VYGCDRRPTQAVRALFNPSPNAGSTDYGIDITTKEKLYALIRIVESTAILFVGADKVKGLDVGGYKVSSWTGTKLGSGDLRHNLDRALELVP
jgi:hypothetical protein